MIFFTGVAPSVYSIKWIYSINGHFDPTENGFVTNLLESAKRPRYMNVTKKDVVTSDMLVELCSSAAENNSDILHVRDLAMVLIAYSGFLRYDELRNYLKCCNDKFFEERISLKIESSKTDKYRSGK